MQFISCDYSGYRHDFLVENADGDTLLTYDYPDEGELGRVIYEDGSQRRFEYGAGDQIGGRQIETVTLPSIRC